MRVFLDANTLISAVRKEYPVYKFSSRIIGLQHPSFQFVTSAVCIAIAYYYACKKFKESEAKFRIQIISRHLLISDCGSKEVVDAFNNKQVHDLEDGLQYYSALSAGCTCIVTENVKDFYYSTIEVMNSRLFLEKYLLFN